MQGVYVEHEMSQVVQTSWAALALMYAKYPHREPIERAAKLVMSRQLPVGVIASGTSRFRLTVH